MQEAQIFTVIALCLYAAAKALIGVISYVVPVVSLLTKNMDQERIDEVSPVM